jgi:hypothetical protein
MPCTVHGDTVECKPVGVGRGRAAPPRRATSARAPDVMSLHGVSVQTLRTEGCPTLASVCFY